MIVTMVTLMLPFAAFAGETTPGGNAGSNTDSTTAWDGTTVDTSWYNESSSNFAISTTAQLAGLAQLVNEGNTFIGKTITLNADIDLGSKEWTPIGTSENPFSGTFDGNGKTISNLTINQSSKTYQGLFGSIKGTNYNNILVHDLNLSNVNIIGSNYTGGLSGKAFTCGVKNVTVSGDIIGGRYVGGLIGHVYTQFDNCTFIGSVTGATGLRDQIGGIAGAGDCRATNCSAIQGSNSDYLVSGDCWNGGIIGGGQEGTSANNCYVKGTILNSSEWYGCSGAGIAGEAGMYETCNFSNNYFDGQVFCGNTLVNTPIIGLVNTEDPNILSNIIVSGNSWNTEYYPNTLTVAVAKMENKSYEQIFNEASRKEQRNTNLVGSVSDLQYIESGNLTLIGQDISTDTLKAFANNSNGVFDIAIDDTGTISITKNIAQVGSQKYTSLSDAITAANNGNKPLELLSDVSIDTWNQIWDVDGLTIKGNNHTITIGEVESNVNGNYLFYGAKDLNISDVTINFRTNGNGFDMISGTLDHVKMVGSDSSSYAVFVGSSSIENNKVTVNNCTFENFDIAVYSQPAAVGSKTSDLSVNSSTFNNCGMTMCSYAPNTTFTNNTVNGGSEISFAGAAENADRDNTYTITGNTFQDAGKIWFYSADLGDVTFVKNKVLGTTSVSTEQAQDTTNLNVSKNYWGGDAPGNGQLSGNNIVGKDEYYQQSSMNEEDLNTYVPPYTGKYSYEINVAKADNGSVSVDKYATEGDKVTITVTPDKAYKLDELSVTAGGKDVELTDNGDGTYSFTMPSSKVQITATFVEDEDYVEPTPEPTPEPSMPFTDVSENDWFYGAVQYVYDNDMMNGVSATSFAPNSNLTRAMMAAVLYNLEDQPTQADSSFTDVADGSWYADAVNWAAANNIVSGYGDGIFGPNDNITREQMASILYRYAEYKGYDVSAVGDLSQFNDADSVSEWANDVMRWAVGAGLINGMGDGSVAPQGTATRAQVATVLMNFCENIAK